MSQREWRTGLGFDCHRLVEGRPLVLGGVEIPFEKGLLGHSDADCLIHAICDAVLGAAGLGDLGRHFPDSDPAYEGIESTLLLRRCVELARKAGFTVHHIDATVVAQRPRLAPYIPRMEERIAACCGLEPGSVNIKATTTEGLGYTGEGLGMAAYAVATLWRRCPAPPAPSVGGDGD